MGSGGIRRSGISAPGPSSNGWITKHRQLNPRVYEIGESPDVVVAQQFLDGADVAAVFEQMGGEGVSKRVRCSAFAEPRPPNSVEHGALQDRLVQVMTAALARSPVDIEPSSGKRPLPRPFPPCVRVFASEGPWQLDPAGATRQIGLMLSLHLAQLPGQRLLGHYRQHRDAILGALTVANDDLVHREVDVLHSQAGALEQAQPGAVEQTGHEAWRPVQLGDDCANLVASQDNRQVLRSPRPNDVVEPGKLLMQDVAIEKQQRAQRLVLG